MHRVISTPGLIAALIAIAAPAQAREERRFAVAVGALLGAADGEPANDIPGAGVFAHYALDEKWALAASVERTEYDFEEPARIVGIAQDPAIEPIDALAEGLALRIGLERSLTDRVRPTHFFLGAGLGVAFTDVPDVAGLRADGERFDIHTEVDTEILASISAGVRRRFGERWYGEAALRLEQHFADWRSTDRISGTQGAIDDYLTWGGRVAVGFRW